MVSEESKIYAVLGIALTILGYIIVKIGKPKDKYALHYARQGLVLGLIWFMAAMILAILGITLMQIPFIGFLFSLIGSFVSGILYLGLFALWVVGIVFSLSEEKKDIPLIGEITKRFFK